jgi:hypothetical protein
MDFSGGGSVWDKTNLTDTFAVVPKIFMNKSTTYFWRVGSTNSGGAGPWSDIYQFTTGTQSGVNDNVPGIFSVWANVSLNSDLVWLMLNSNEIQTVNIQIMDLMGISVYNSNDYEISQGLNSVPIDFSKYAKGVYIYKIVSSEGIIAGKFITY